nr:MAG TPA: hypothetical protein [Caudoviricetes sp.]
MTEPLRYYSRSIKQSTPLGHISLGTWLFTHSVYCTYSVHTYRAQVHY